MTMNFLPEEELKDMSWEELGAYKRLLVLMGVSEAKTLNQIDTIIKDKIAEGINSYKSEYTKERQTGMIPFEKKREFIGSIVNGLTQAAEAKELEDKKRAEEYQKAKLIEVHASNYTNMQLSLIETLEILGKRTLKIVTKEEIFKAAGMDEKEIAEAKEQLAQKGKSRTGKISIEMIP